MQHSRGTVYSVNIAVKLTSELMTGLSSMLGAVFWPICQAGVQGGTSQCRQGQAGTEERVCEEKVQKIFVLQKQFLNSWPCITCQSLCLIQRNPQLNCKHQSSIDWSVWGCTVGRLHPWKDAHSLTGLLGWTREDRCDILASVSQRH